MMLLLLSLLAPAETGADPQGAWPAVAAHQLPENDGLYLRWDPSRSWGTAKLVEVMAQVSERLAFELPHAQPLLIGDVSRRGGGALFGHVTHHMGIDADIGLFLHDQKQPLGGFQRVRPDQIDLHATWVLLRALLDHPDVAFVLLDQAHIDALRDHVLSEVGLDPELVARIFPDPRDRLPWEVRGVVRHAPNHASHMHVRITHRPGT